jgi:transcriptional regulator with XRE-family HTH domain
MQDARPIAQVVGANARKHRRDHGVTLDELAKSARQLGLKWSPGKAGDFESGRVNPTLPTLFAVCAALSEITGEPTSLSELLESDGPIVVNESLTVKSSVLRRALAGDVIDLKVGDIEGSAEELADRINASLVGSFPDGVSMRDVKKNLAAAGEAEQRAARELGLTALEMAAHSAKLWDGLTLSQERDRIAGTGANPQKRGRVSRDLKDRLRRAVEGVSRGDD